MKKREYFVPTAKVVLLNIERGFEASLEDPEFDKEIEW